MGRAAAAAAAAAAAPTAARAGAPEGECSGSAIAACVEKSAPIIGPGLPGLEYYSEIHGGTLEQPGARASGKYERFPLKWSPLWQFVVQMGRATQTLLRDVFAEEGCASLRLCVDASTAALVAFNTSFTLATAWLEGRVEPGLLGTPLPIGISVWRAASMLQRELVRVALGVQSAGTVGGQRLALERAAHLRLVHLHMAAFQLLDIIQQLPQVPRFRFHQHLGVSRGSIVLELLRERARELPPDALLRMVEVGVDTAEAVPTLLTELPALRYLGVDPYAPCGRNRAGAGEDCWPPPERRYAEALARLLPFGGRANLLRAPSREACGWLAEASLDLIWIDALHTYEDVARDLQAWAPKLRPGGFVAGHDYSSAFPGVVDAVHEAFVARPPLDGRLHLAPDFAYFWRWAG